MRNRRIFSVFLAFLLLLAMFASAHADIEIYYLDVGQGDCAVVLCDGEAMIIDGGQPNQSQFVYSYLQNTLGLDALQYMVATHPDSDHIGGLSAALNACRVGAIYSSTSSSGTKAFQSLIKYAARQGLAPIIPQAGDTCALGGAEITFLAPASTYADDNNASIVLKITYGRTSFLFTGDIEAAAEADILRSGADVGATVLKVAHHGSDTSSSDAFLEAVQPQYAIISVGDNAYGHPSERVLNRLQSIGSTVYRTDTNGTIICRSDGDSIEFLTEKENNAATASPEPENTAAAPYIGNRNSHKFHYAGCSSVDSMKEKNKVELQSREDAVSAGYIPCKRCNP